MKAVIWTTMMRLMIIRYLLVTRFRMVSWKVTFFALWLFVGCTTSREVKKTIRNSGTAMQA